MPQSDQETVQSILTEINNLGKIMKGKTKQDLEFDLTLERAVTMTLGLIGEKTNKVSAHLRTENPEIEWRKIIALRNRIVHSYDDLDFDIIYEIIKDKIPILKKQLRNIQWVKQRKVVSPTKRTGIGKGKK